MSDKPIQSLPITRRSQIFFIIKEDPSLLFFINLTGALFFVPLAFVATWGIISFGALGTKEGVTANEMFLSIFFPALASIPAITIAGIGMCGIYSVISRLVTRTTSSYSVFWIGIKDNWKQFVLTHTIIGFLMFFFLTNLAAFYYTDLNAGLKLFSLIISSILLVVFLFIKPFILFQCTLFDNNYIIILRNSLGFIGKRFLYNLLAFLISIIMFVLIGFLPGWFRVVPIVFIGGYWLMFEALVNYIICINTLETKYPREITAEFYRRGLEKEED